MSNTHESNQGMRRTKKIAQFEELHDDGDGILAIMQEFRVAINLAEIRAAILTIKKRAQGIGWQPRDQGSVLHQC